MRNILVFFGGKSVEHDVSVITGVMTLNSLNKEQYNAIPVFVDKDGKWYSGSVLIDVEFYKDVDYTKLYQVALLCGNNYLYKVKGKRLKPQMRIYCAINCMHGERGEDGSLSGLLNMCDIPLASPDMLSSAVAMDKAFTKTCMKALKIPTVESFTVSDVEQINGNFKLSFPVIVKPNCLGSSIGIQIAEDKEQLKDAIFAGLRYSEKVIIEPLLKDVIEINCACFMGDDDKVKVSECERPFSSNKILTFSDKYSDGVREFPANISREISEKIKEYTKKVYVSLEFNGIIRIDYFIKDDKVYLNEINAVPGSLAYYLFCDTKKQFQNILGSIINKAVKDYYHGDMLIKNFNSNILNIKGIKGGKHLQ